MAQGTQLHGIPNRYRGISVIAVMGLVIVGLLIIVALMSYGKFGKSGPKVREASQDPGTAGAFMQTSNGAQRAATPVDEDGRKQREALEARLKNRDELIDRWKQDREQAKATESQVPPRTHVRVQDERSPQQTKPAQAPPPPLNRARASHAKAPRLLLKREFKPPDDALGVRTLRPGWMIPFFVESLVNSAIPGSFKARVSHVVSASHDHRVPLIPSGAIIVGTAQSGSLVPGSERLPMMGVTVDWPGVPKPLDLGSMPIMDQQGQMGMVDEIDRHLLFIAASIVAKGAMEGASRMIEQEANQMGQGGEIPASIANGTERAADRQLQTMYDIRPTIRVHAGSRGYVFLTKTVPVPPWEFPR